MKKIFLICLTAGFISNGFAQSSVADVPENKIKPAYETAPAAKQQPPATQKIVAPKPVLNSVGLNAHDQPKVQPAPVVNKPVEVNKTEPTVPSKLQGITATSKDQPAVAGQHPASSTVVETRVKSPGENASVPPASSVKKPGPENRQ